MALPRVSEANIPPVQARGGVHVAPPSQTTPQEAPATPIILWLCYCSPLPINTSPFVGNCEGANTRKPSAAILTAPFSAIDIADAAAHLDEDTDDPTIKDGSIRRAQ